jgi:hypothetical protein
MIRCGSHGQVEFPERAVKASIMVAVQSLEASSYGAVKSSYGYVASPVLDVTPSMQTVLAKTFTITIPHRGTSTKHLVRRSHTHVEPVASA